MTLTTDQRIPSRYFPKHHQNSRHHGNEICAQLWSDAMLFHLLGDQLRVLVRARPAHEEACLCQDRCFLPCNNRLCYLDLTGRRHRFIDAQSAVCVFWCGKEMAHHPILLLGSCILWDIHLECSRFATLCSKTKRRLDRTDHQLPSLELLGWCTRQPYCSGDGTSIWQSKCESDIDIIL